MRHIHWMLAAASLAAAGCANDGGLFGEGSQRQSGAETASAPKADSQPQASSQQAQQGGQDAVAIAASAELVRKVQRALDERGIDGGPVDGVWGEQTQRGVTQFQRSQGLEPNGQLDTRTLSALGVYEAGSAATGSGGGK